MSVLPECQSVHHVYAVTMDAGEGVGTLEQSYRWF